MNLLDRKLLRDFRALKSQALAVALVMACGLAMMIMTRSLILSLATTRDRYYQQNRFADVFARLKRAPDAVREQLAAIPGVAAVETSIAVQVTLDVPGQAEPAVGLINSLPRLGERSRRGRQKLQEIAGTVPAIAGYPAGCRFNPRCPEATDICLAVSPEPTPLPAHGLVRCHHHG